MTTRIERGETDVAVHPRKDSEDVFEIVPQEDGGYRLSVNGEVISCFYWTGDELDECVRTLNRMRSSRQR